MKTLLRTGILVLCVGMATLMIVNAAFPATYYIDYTGGSDSNNGTKSTPWKRHPYMVGFAGSYTHTTGDRFIFKGGVAWPNAVFPLTITESGSSGSDDYYGVDKSWYSGTSWSRPVFDAQNKTISGRFNTIIRIWSQQHVTIDNIEMVNLYWAGTPNYGYVAYISAAGSDYLTLDHLYLHHWTFDSSASDINGGLIHGDTNQPVHQHSVLQNSMIQNSDGNYAMGAAVWAWGSMKNCVIHDVINAYVSHDGGTKEISRNHIYNIRNSSSPTHKNAIELVGNSSSPSSTWYIHDNYIHDLEIGESLMIGNPNETVYVWNNVIYNLFNVGANSPHFPQSSGTAGHSVTFWNNTIVPLSGRGCFVQNGSVPMTYLTIQNNHCITTESITSSVTTPSSVINHNLLQTPAAAAGQGYVATNNYAPSSVKNSTVRSGTNIPSSLFTTDILGVSRITAPAWDIGAYQFSEK